MSFSSEIKNIIIFSLTGLFEGKKLRKIFLLLTLTYLIQFFAYNLILIFNPLNMFEQSIGSNPELILNYFANLFLVTILLTIPLMLITAILEYYIIFEGLGLKKIKSKKIDLTRYIKFFFSPLIVLLYSSISIFELKFLAIGLTAGLLTIIGFFVSITGNYFTGLFVLFLGIILFFAYLLIVLYELYRLSLTTTIFVEGNNSIVDSMEESWNLTRNNFFNILATWIIFFIILFIVSSVITIPSTIYSFINSLFAQNVLILDPIYNLLILPTVIFSAYIVVAKNCINIGIFTTLKNMKSNTKKTIKKNK